jgi:hypothetical protein
MCRSRLCQLTLEDTGIEVKAFVKAVGRASHPRGHRMLYISVLVSAHHLAGGLKCTAEANKLNYAKTPKYSMDRGWDMLGSQKLARKGSQANKRKGPFS